jgi:amino acid adenylation domain-containing protein
MSGIIAKSRPYRNIPDRFAAQAAARPSALGVLSDAGVLTYGELEARANQLARILRRRGAGPDVPVAVCLERTSEMIVAVLAILKAGGAYMPLEPTYPADRLAFMLADAGAALILTEERLGARLPANCGPVVTLEALSAELGREPETPLEGVVGADHLAYLMYTSGSTGTPKGVAVPHRAVDRLVCDVDYARLGADEVLLHAAPLGFDASTFEIWGALLNGGRCALYPDPFPTGPGLRSFIARHQVTTAWLTAALFNAIVDEDPTHLQGLRQILTGGEALSVSHVRRALAALPHTQIINGYGPTETTTFATTYSIPRFLDPELRSIPIGRAIRDTPLYVLDEAREPVVPGEIGELYIGGAGVARGYLRRPELTAERFLPAPQGATDDRVYRTGDLVRSLPDGSLDYVGRVDQQVKIRGFRIETGEIEATLGQHPAVRSTVVVAREDRPGDKRLVAYLTAAGPLAAQPSASALRDHLGSRLPEYMVPSAFVWLDALPMTPNGKVDRRALPAPSLGRPDLAQAYVAAGTPTEVHCVGVFEEMLGVLGVGVHDNFFDLGGNSLLALKAIRRLRDLVGRAVPPVEFFQAPTAAGIAAYLVAGDGREALERALREREKRLAGAGHSLDGVAIVAMAGRFPGARSVEEFWRNLCDGKEGITFFGNEALDPSIPSEERKDPAYVCARGVLEDVEFFDAAFFGINPREAEIMDPQQRLFLETCWEALERGGYPPDSFPGAIGVFGGMYNATYYQRHVVTRPDLIEKVGVFQTMVANEKDYVATRVAHKLNLTGPAISVHTACSTSLVAICQAFDSLRSGHCDLALAGGAAVTCPPRSGYLYQEGGMLSVDGHTRAFDADAQGTVFSDGVAVVLLKRLQDAVADRDTIYAVIRGAAVNNDGALKASFTAPSVVGQATVIATAQAVAGIDPRTISYVETHGTATPLGDPIEVEGLTRAFRAKTQDTGFCAIGSVKSNVGHLVIAAGAAGLIKTALALTEKRIPPSLHYRAPNPKIDFSVTPFYVNTRLADWPAGPTPRRAGVSAFGVGGTNAHVVVEEAPPSAPPAELARSRHLLVLSARSKSALDRACANLAGHLEAHPGHSLADVAFTLQAGRKAFAHRRALVVEGHEQAIAALRPGEPGPSSSRLVDGPPPAVAFMFPGQGAQYAAMGRSLYAEEAVFRAAVDRCALMLEPHLGRDLRHVLYPKDGDLAAAALALRDTALTQPALFTIEYALSRLWMEVGVRPAAMIGHSVGEFVCATLAGVFSLEDALRLVAARGRLMQALPPGSMLSVRLGADALAPRLPASVVVASDNGPALCVLAGPMDAVAPFQAELEGEGVACRLLQTSHAFHSPMMDPILEPFRAIVNSVRLSPPAIPFVSTVTGDWITSEQATDPSYWTLHLRKTVRFAPAVRTLLQDPARLLLEVGPRATLATLARQQAVGSAKPRAVTSLTDSVEGECDAWLQAVGQAWTAGVSVDWVALSPGRRRVLLPTYPFERQRFWIDPRPAAAPTPSAPEPIADSPTAVALETVAPEVTPMNALAAPAATPRRDRLVDDLRLMFEDVSGIDMDGALPDTTFFELGLDSLALTQVALQLQRTFSVKITFRQLMEAYPSLERLADFMDQNLPPEAAAPAPPAPAVSEATPRPQPIVSLSAPTGLLPGHVQQVIDAQLQLMAQQLALLGAAPAPAPAQPVAAPRASMSAVVVGAQPAVPVVPSVGNGAAPTNGNGAGAPALDEEVPAGPMKYDVKKAFGAIARIHTSRSEELTPHQKAKLESFIHRYCARTRRSKEYTQAHRAHLADPRVVNGFRPAWKEAIYQIVIERSRGSHVVDIDGNEYVDALNGFGMSMFGWQPEFVTKAVKEQLELGYEIGPQHPLAGEVAKLICEFTGFDRAGLCNTGSEAVMGAMRIARTVTGRGTIATFNGSYHGIFDEVIVRGTKKLKAVPAAPGIMPSSAQNVLVLDYGTPESLAILKSRADELAGIMVEPVQSRRPDFQPREFLGELRALTERSGIVYIFDEVVTGFRAHPGGAQAVLGVKADLATYGKVIGGGFPIGVIAGKREYMDALDGGFWQYGDESVPTVGVTYFAGTFVRHPLALAAAKASLDHLKEAGPSLQADLNARTAEMAEELNTFFALAEAPLKIKHFASVWKMFFLEDHPLGDLIFAMLRDRGIHILDNFPCFMTTAHSAADIAWIVRAFKESVREMQEAGFLPAPTRVPEHMLDTTKPPVPGARLGRDPNGDPAWFVPNPDEPGKYLRVN